mmetsp:Transcript_13506/g.36433  ORF Transcript_13506/g.36433 Transcript_13506/m.36433 type:complete len:509 (+) Transcript_13506:124-1650(+)
MLWSLYSRSSFNAGELAAMEKLAACQRQLNGDDVVGCEEFLKAIEATSIALGLEAAPREYRSEFSVNYHALFPDSGRHYRVDVLEASTSEQSAIWVNGDKFELSPEAMHHAEALQRAWSRLCALLERWSVASQTQRTSSRPTKPTRDEVADALTTLDTAWASFEHKYIVELIGIEAHSRRIVVHAVEKEARYRRAKKLEGAAEREEALDDLVKAISRLNSVANFRRKGRDDLGSEIFRRAVAVLERKDAEAVNVLATDVVESLEAICLYLREVSRCMERVDPHLCNNVGLVARLEDWEESWEVGAKCLLQDSFLDAVNDQLVELHTAQRLAPAFVDMVDNCDVELFLVLPRLILLCFLADPGAKRVELLRNLLPHRFGELQRDKANLADPCAGTSFRELGPELKVLVEHFKRTVAVLDQGGARSRTHGTATWEILVRRAVAGAEGDGDFCHGCSPATQTAVQDLMREVEWWSLELQRHCPEDWNQWSAVIVQCLNGSPKPPTSNAFQV